MACTRGRRASPPGFALAPTLLAEASPASLLPFLGSWDHGIMGSWDHWVTGSWKGISPASHHGGGGGGDGGGGSDACTKRGSLLQVPMPWQYANMDGGSGGSDACTRRRSLLQVIMMVVEVVVVVVVVDQMHAPGGDLSCKSPCQPYLLVKP